MLGDIDWFDFDLAERLSMSVAQLHEYLSNSEYLQWRAYHNYKDAVMHKSEAGD